jgi:hypothetical protein
MAHRLTLPPVSSDHSTGYELPSSDVRVTSGLPDNGQFDGPACPKSATRRRPIREADIERQAFNVRFVPIATISKMLRLDD